MRRISIQHLTQPHYGGSVPVGDRSGDRHVNTLSLLQGEEPVVTGGDSPGTALVTVPPGVVHHPALAVHTGGAPRLAGVTVPGRARLVTLPTVQEGEDAGLATAAHRLTRLWGEKC